MHVKKIRPASSPIPHPPPIRMYMRRESLLMMLPSVVVVAFKKSVIFSSPPIISVEVTDSNIISSPELKKVKGSEVVSSVLADVGSSSVVAVSEGLVLLGGCVVATRQ